MKEIEMKITSKTPTDVQLMKQEIANEVAAELDSLVNHLDNFLEERLSAEFDELKADIITCKKINDVLRAECTRIEAAYNDAQKEYLTLKESLIAATHVNDVLMEENMRFRDEITCLSLQTLKQAIES
jgi:BMFP domain-containing protein YqiC